MKKWKRALTGIAIAAVMCVGVGVAAGCGDNEDNKEHKEHTWATEWSKDETKHWKETTCPEHDPEKKDEGTHVDTDGDGKCDVCEYVMSTDTGDEGTEDNPYSLEEGSIKLKIPANGSVYYAAYTLGVAKIYTLISDSNKVSLSVYNSLNSQDAEVYESDSDGFYCEAEVPSMSYYVFAFSTKDGAAAEYSVSVSVSDVQSDGGEEGSSENPYIINDFKEYSAEVKVVNGMFGPDLVPAHFRYTASSAITLYFAVGENTTLNVQYVNAAGGSIYKTLDELADGLELEAGTVITIEVSTANGTAGSVSFEISDSPIATLF